jgi:Predicted transcriptional regulators
MFATLILPFDSYRELPTPTHRWLMQCLARYADRAGKAWPTMRQLAEDARMSASTVCRRLKELAGQGCFTRERKGVGRYVYTLAEPYRLGRPGHVSGVKHGVSRAARQEVEPSKYLNKGIWLGEAGLPRPTEWGPRLRSWRKSGFWLAAWGPRPGEAGCFAPLAG